MLYYKNIFLRKNINFSFKIILIISICFLIN
nr:MAG TPA: hypothetical protein [Caudoviricetes sp.]